MYACGAEQLGEITARGDHWLASKEHPTIADVAVFPYVALAPSSSKGAIALETFPHVLAWVERFKAWKGFSPMPAF